MPERMQSYLTNPRLIVILFFALIAGAYIYTTTKTTPPLSTSAVALTSDLTHEQWRTQLLHHEFTAALEAQVRQLRAGKVEGASDVLRVIEPGMMYTTDYIEERMNVDVDENGVVTDVSFN